MKSTLAVICTFGIALSGSAHADSLQSAEAERGDAYAHFYKAIQSGQSPRAAFATDLAPAEQNVAKALSEVAPSQSSAPPLNSGALSTSETVSPAAVDSNAPSTDAIDGSQFPRELSF
jgi:hypothetical protein